MFFDEAKIHVKAGDGGNGAVASGARNSYREAVQPVATAARAAMSSLRWTLN